MSGNGPAVDKRSLRTRNQIASALISLGHGGGLDRLTVRQLADAAGISRSTFYAHFPSLEDYLAESFGNMLERLAEHAARPPGQDARLLATEAILDHIASAPAYVAEISRSKYRPRMLRRGEDRLQLHVQRRLKVLRPNLNTTSRAATSRFVAGAFVALLREWMESGMKKPAADLRQQFEELTARL